MQYEALLRDARNQQLTTSTRLHAAFDAIYTCKPNVELLLGSLGVMAAEHGDAVLVSRLADWAMHTAPLEPLPMSPEEAVALAERVRAALGGK